MSFHYKEVVTPRETTPCTSSQLYRFYVGIYEGSMLGQTKRHLFPVSCFPAGSKAGAQGRTEQAHSAASHILHSSRPEPSDPGTASVYLATVSLRNLPWACVKQSKLRLYWRGKLHRISYYSSKKMCVKLGLLPTHKNQFTLAILHPQPSPLPPQIT